MITGKGRLDHQSFGGKVVGGVYELCQKHQKPMMVVCGQHLSFSKPIIDFPIYTVLEKAISIEDAIKNAAFYLQEIGEELKFVL